MLSLFHAFAQACAIFPIIFNISANIFKISSAVVCTVPLVHIFAKLLPIAIHRFFIPSKALCIASITVCPVVSHAFLNGSKINSNIFLIFSANSSYCAIRELKSVGDISPPAPPPELLLSCNVVFSSQLAILLLAFFALDAVLAVLLAVLLANIFILAKDFTIAPTTANIL